MRAVLVLVGLFLTCFQFQLSESQKSYESEDYAAGFRESCADVQCNPNKNLVCLKGDEKCGCEEGFDFDKSREECLILPTAQNDFACLTDYQCHESTYGLLSRCSEGQCQCFDETYERKVILRTQDNICFKVMEVGDRCTSDLECNATIPGEAACLGLESTNAAGFCTCAVGHIFDPAIRECLKLGKVGSPCKTSLQCQDSSALGKLSRCNNNSEVCECWAGKERVSGLDGRCFLSRAVNETCDSTEECMLGFHKNSECLWHEAYNFEKVCQCSPGKECRNAGNRFSLPLGLLAAGLLVSYYYYYQ
jgi:hypothetical protein